MAYDADAIEKYIFEAMQELGHPDNVAFDIAFHMADWLANLEKLQEFYENPDKFTKDQTSDILMGFLIHAPHHLAAAGKLITGFPVTDVFKIGAVSES